MFEYLIPTWWQCLGMFMRHGLAGASLSRGRGWEMTFAVLFLFIYFVSLYVSVTGLDLAV